MGEQPYKNIGARLKRLREKAQESLLEVCGAVEIDEKTLTSIEAGKQLPDEDILMLLMTHFDVPEQESVRLWELAGYTKETDKTLPLAEEQLKQIMMVIPFDNRVVFSDMAHVDANDNGVVISFALSAGNIQPQTVVRVGMSIKQANQLVAQLNDQLEVALKPKVIRQISAPKKSKKTEKKNQP